jgi:hypothetical protein
MLPGNGPTRLSLSFHSLFHFMVADELAVTVGTQIILFTIAFFPLRVMVGLWQWGQVISMGVSIIP